MVRLTQPEILNNIHNCASKSDDHDAWCDVCARSTASVYDVKRRIKSKLREKNAKFTVQYKDCKDFSWILQNS